MTKPDPEPDPDDTDDGPTIIGPADYIAGSLNGTLDPDEWHET